MHKMKSTHHMNMVINNHQRELFKLLRKIMKLIVNILICEDFFIVLFSIK